MKEFIGYVIHIKCILCGCLYSCSRIMFEGRSGKTSGCTLNTMNCGHDKIVFRYGRFRIWMMVEGYIIEAVDAVSGAC